MFHIDIVTTLFKRVSLKIHIDIACFSTSRSMSTFHNLRELVSYWDNFGDLSCTLVELTSFSWFIHLLHLWTLLKMGIFVDPKICPKSILTFYFILLFIWFNLIFTLFFFFFCSFLVFHLFFPHTCNCRTLPLLIFPSSISFLCFFLFPSFLFFFLFFPFLYSLYLLSLPNPSLAVIYLPSLPLFLFIILSFFFLLPISLSHLKDP